MPITLAIVIATLVSASGPPAEKSGAESPQQGTVVAPMPRLHVSIRTGRDRYELALDTTTGTTTRLDTHASAPIVIPMPGSDLSAELRRPTWSPHRDLYIVRRAEDGSELGKTKICDMSENPRHVAWHSGWGRLIYVRGARDAGILQVHDPRTGEETTLAVTGVIESVRLSGDSQIGVLTTTERDGKERKVSLVVFRGRAMGRAIVTDEPISSFAWSPDGTSIVYSVPGELRRHNFIGDGRPDVVRLGALDTALWNHVADSIDIAPDGTLALILNFAGGRASALDADEEPKPMAGDRQVFLLNWPDRLRTIDLKAQPLDLHWHVDPAPHPSR